MFLPETRPPVKNFLLSFLIILAAFAAGRYLFPDAPAATATQARSINVKATPIATPLAPGNTYDARNSPTHPFTNAPTPTYTPEEERTIRLFEEASPAVCFITTKAIRRSFWSYESQEVDSGSGSGFTWDKEGHVITNFHVINGANTSSISVTLSSGKSYDARIVGYEKEKGPDRTQNRRPGRRPAPHPGG